jgi:hypothetical protein
MRRQLTFMALCATPLAAVVCLAAATHAHGEEWEERSAYYEDDAWYDVTEWLDGNDYNPTDEVAGKVDDEAYDWAAIESDQDNDSGAGYGYDANDKGDDWYYDYYGNNRYSYYDYLDDDGYYDYSYEYFDYDNDGYYDALASYHDTDGDGSYEDYDYYSFNTNTGASGDASNDQSSNNNQTASNNQGQQQQQQQSKQQARGGSKQFQASGTVKSTKRVQVRQGGERLIAQISGDQGKMFLVDLGRPDQLGQPGQQKQQANGQPGQQQNQQANAQQGPPNQPVKQGDQITAHGPVIKVGDKQVVLAQTVKIGQQQEQPINRSGRTINGQISKMKTAKVRGQDHQMAIVQLQSGKQALVDLGPTDKLQVSLNDGDQIQVSGVPVKVQDRLVVLANTVTKGGDKTKIDRVASKQAQASS